MSKLAYIVIAFMSLCLAACDEVKKRTPHPDQALQRESTQSCRLNMCFNRRACRGSQSVVIKTLPVTEVYESGKVRTAYQSEVTSIGQCK